MPLGPSHRAYRDLVAKYCVLIEADVRTSLASLLAIRDVLVELYMASVNMPEVVAQNFDDVPERLTYEDYRVIKDKIGAFTRTDLFWICYHPFQSAPDAPICASLSDGLADIWLDLKRGLLALAQDEEKWAAAVFWDWKFSFDTHWGDHAAESIYGIHMLLRDDVVQP